MMDDVTLPCGTCRLCCHAEVVTLEEQDDRTLFDPDMLYTIPLEDGPAWAMKHKPNGECIALAEGGCSIYEIRPIICRTFDCRAAYLKISKLYSRADRRRLAKKGHLDPKVYNQGRKMLDEALLP